MGDLKFVIEREEGKYIRYICPHCGATIMISDGTAEVELSERCGHCGRHLHYRENKEN